MSKKLSGPVLYDSLDRPNADQRMPVQQKQNTNAVWIVFILVIAILIALLVLYVLIWLNQSGAIVALWIINSAVIFGIVGIIIAGVLYAFVLALKHAMYTLNDGIPVSIFSALFARYDKTFEQLSTRYFDMWTKRMEHSQYSGVSTLTLDQSSQVETSTTSVQTTDDDPTPLQSITTENDKSVLEDLSDKGFINRSDNSLFVGFIQE